MALRIGALAFVGVDAWTRPSAFPLVMPVMPRTALPVVAFLAGAVVLGMGGAGLGPLFPVGPSAWGPRMSDATEEPGPGLPGDIVVPPRRVLITAVLRSILSAVVVVLIYFLIPMTDMWETRSITGFVVGLLIVLVVLVLQGRVILRAPYPVARTVEALSTTGPLFVIVFAAAHYAVGTLEPGSYTQAMSRLDALYFTVTTFATVGYGDISPVSETARTVTLVQMVLGLILVGIVARVITGAAQLGMKRRSGRSPSSG